MLRVSVMVMVRIRVRITLRDVYYLGLSLRVHLSINLTVIFFCL